ncbi:MAG TPA: hypothetical protein VNX27_11035 [Chthoniobacterales bacterium]|jgi:hypothetical protein|nr:hypothetical protein [Chthoniobacterales bacterium]
MALIILAVVPLDPVRSLARYLLVAYLPGLAIWKHLPSNASSLVDLVLYPSLLSVLPFFWVALACVFLGCDLWISGWIAIVIFLGIGFAWGWTGRIYETKGDRIAIIVASVLVVFLLVVPFAANSFQAVAWDAPLHAAIVSRILDGFVPPDSPIMAGQPANYYWLCHFYSAVLMRITGLSVYQVFAILNVHAFVLFFLAGYRIAGRLTRNVFGRISAAWMLVFGLNAFGWIIFLTNGSASPEKWYSLVAPFAMVKGYSPSLGNIIHEFLDGIPFAMSFAFDIAWLDVLLARVDGERRGILITGALVLATAFYLHPLSAVFLTAASFASVGIFLLINGTRKSEWAALAFDLGVVMFAAALVTMPYAWNILHAKTGAPLSIDLSPAYWKSEAYSILATVGLIGIIAAPALWLAFRRRQRAILVLALFAATITIVALITRIALEAEYKLIYLLAFGLAPLVAIAWSVWSRTLLTRSIFALALAISVPTNALTSYCFATQPPRENRDPTRLRLLDWIRAKTPSNAILVEYPWWEKYQTSDAAFFYLDRFWFDIGVYAHRRQLVGYIAPMLEQWGYRDIGLRQELAHRLLKGELLAPADASYLVGLRAPIIVVTNLSVVGNEEFDPTTYVRIYEDGDLRAYRVVLPSS